MRSESVVDVAVPTLSWQVLSVAAIVAILVVVLRKRHRTNDLWFLMGKIVFCIVMLPLLLWGAMATPSMMVTRAIQPMQWNSEVLAETDNVEVSHQVPWVPRGWINTSSSPMSDFSSCLVLLGGVGFIGLISKTIAQRFDNGERFA